MPSIRLMIFWMIVPAMTAAQSSNFEVSDITKRGQIGDNTCWAATIEMLNSKYLKASSLYQLEVIRNESLIKDGECTEYANCDTIYSNKIDPISFKDFNDSLKILEYTYKAYYHTNKSPIKKDSLWTLLKHQFQNDSPVIIWRQFNSKSDAHIYLSYGYVEQVIANQSIKLLMIYDPWSKVLDSVGLQYTIDFDQLYAKTGTSNATSLNPSLAMLYGFSSEKITQTSNFNSYPTFASKKKFLQSKRKVSKKLVEELTNSFKINSTPEIRNQLGFANSQNNTFSDPIKVKYIQIGKGKDGSGIKQFQTNIEEILFQLNPKLNGEFEFVVACEQMSGEKKYHATMSRIEPYETSLMAITKRIREDELRGNNQISYSSRNNNSNLNSSFRSYGVPALSLENLKLPMFDSKNLKLKSSLIYYHRSYDKKPDFLLIPIKSLYKREFLLVDLFDYFDNRSSLKLPEIPGYSTPRKLNSFNFKLYKVGASEIDDILKYLSK